MAWHADVDSCRDRTRRRRHCDEGGVSPDDFDDFDDDDDGDDDDDDDAWCQGGG